MDVGENADHSPRDALRLEEWTSCQVYGHLFQDGQCADCGEEDE